MKNLIFEWARFNRWVQHEDKLAEQYIAALYNLAESCEYGNMKSELIRDRLVVGICDMGLSERLQADEKLTLDKAKKAITIKEAVYPITLDGMQTNRSPAIKRQSTSLVASNLPRRKCTRCGKTHDRKLKCPARDTICRRCNHKGHYESQCFSKTVSAVALEDSLTEESLDENTEHVQSKRYLDCTSSIQPKTWTATILVGGKPALFKLDTGAKVTAVSDQFYQECSAPLQKPSQLLYSPGRYPIQVLEQFTEILQYKDKLFLQTVFVALLGVQSLIHGGTQSPATRFTYYSARISSAGNLDENSSKPPGNSALQS